ncbi:hypothetical protein JIN85_03235 [Luteolibacter pohnpeiensis]|uniref:Nuclease n=1 Tax=Luteolibacter pohnpeiensis TaxID=454153 RepID=A0A934S3V1_9BACT|nr:hypothetical protein [Luteolibacter pohnpeiensis]MBK1881413.1 hypothetical protein [Luteolibacter pohnpeiensis]
MNESASKALPGLICILSLLSVPTALGWDYQGHRMVNQIALASLPADFPSFVKEPAAAERIAFLAGEPDRWRNTQDLPIKHFSSPNHYLDYEQIQMAGLNPQKLPPMRYDFVTQFAAGRASHLAAFPKVDPEKNADHTAEWPGFLPWQIAEDYGKLKSGFSYLKELEALGTPDEIANAKANIIYIMGTMGHYVGDGSQPLHITIHHNGWVGDNPNDYTRWSGFHAWIDGGFIQQSGIQLSDMLPEVKPVSAWTLTEGSGDPVFAKVFEYIQAQHAFVEPIYQLEKKGAFRAENPVKSEEGKKFIEQRLLSGGRTLAEIWLTAYREAGPDSFLRRVLEERKAKEAESAKETKDN